MTCGKDYDSTTPLVLLVVSGRITPLYRVCVYVCVNITL